MPPIPYPSPTSPPIPSTSEWILTSILSFLLAAVLLHFAYYFINLTIAIWDDAQRQAPGLPPVAPRHEYEYPDHPFRSDP